MDKSIAKVLKIKNEIELTELIVENCSEHSEALDGYFVVLDYKNISDVKSFLMTDYSNFQANILKAFDSFNEEGRVNDLLNIMEIYKNGGTYTEAILEANGGIEAILGKSVVLDLGGSEDSEEEEMYKEMYEELKTKYEEKKAEVEELKSSAEEVVVLKEVLRGLDKLEYEHIDGIIDVLQELQPDDFEEMVYDLISDNAERLMEDPSYDTAKLPVLSIYLNQMVDWLQAKGHLGDVANE